jgi:hypothetical protein
MPGIESRSIKVCLDRRIGVLPPESRENDLYRLFNNLN